MPRLIDKDEALKRLTWDSFAYQEINMMESVDTEPVVRCKECNWFERNNTKKGEVLYCYYHEMNIKEDDFCSWGEVREDGQTD